ncbi:hypothetical protein [Ochrobactrum sp. S1502_03]|uniref:hypothetical protein n=1 Tax=Ochrobactrum sp. S1502_03 TaxID=3108451 RepID=UPI0037C559FD
MNDLAPDVQMKVIEYLIAQENAAALEPKTGFGFFVAFIMGLLIGGIITAATSYVMRRKP